MALTGGQMTISNKKSVAIVAPILTRSGYGEQSRFALRALRSREDLYDIHIMPLDWGQTSWISERDEEREYIDDRIRHTMGAKQNSQFQCDIALHITIPNEFQKIAPMTIGYTAGIETTAISPKWAQKANEIDKLIVVSEHSKYVFENAAFDATQETGAAGSPITQTFVYKVDTPIAAVGYPVKTFPELPELPLELRTSVNFLCVAQFGPRKNIPNTVKYFVEEFHDEDVGLIIKTNMAKNCLMDRELIFEDLKRSLDEAFPDRKCVVYLLHGDMTDKEMHALYKHPKIQAFVCLSHGEGFGLPFFEAAYSGIPVICVNYSGQRDFLIDEEGNLQFYEVQHDLKEVQPECIWEDVIVKESKWAYPREFSAKEAMRNCYNDILNNTGLVASMPLYAEVLKERFSEEKMYDAFLRGFDPHYKIEEKYESFLELLNDED